jgi:hypothetical protein
LFISRKAIATDRKAILSTSGEERPKADLSKFIVIFLNAEIIKKVVVVEFLSLRTFNAGSVVLDD